MVSIRFTKANKCLIFWHKMIFLILVCTLIYQLNRTQLDNLLEKMSVFWDSLNMYKILSKEYLFFVFFLFLYCFCLFVGFVCFVFPFLVMVKRQSQ